MSTMSPGPPPELEAAFQERGATRPGLWSRRQVLAKSIVITAGSWVLMVIERLPVVGGLERAFATKGTEYSSCTAAGYSYDDTTYACTGSAYIDSAYCGPDKWFLNWSGTCWAQWAISICGSPARNAWRWTRLSTPYRCADGYGQSCGSGPTLLICQAPNP